jgi:hypothetical protein
MVTENTEQHSEQEKAKPAPQVKGNGQDRLDLPPAEPINGEPAGPPTDIFNNLAALRLQPEAGALVGAVEVLAHVPIRKPSPTEWVRVHPGADMTLASSFYVDKENRETYFVPPEMREVLITGVKVMLLVTAITSRGALFLWPLALGDDTGRTNAWHDTAKDAAMQAKSVWTKIAADMSAGHYRVFKAEGNLPEPTWPDKAFAELLRIAFRGRIVDSVDHPVVRQCRGMNP